MRFKIVQKSSIYGSQTLATLWCKSLKGQSIPVCKFKCPPILGEENLTLTLTLWPVRALFAEDASAFRNNLDLNFNTLILLS